MDAALEGAPLGPASPLTSGEDRLVVTFALVSAAVHLTVLLAGSFAWTRAKPPLSDEWTMDADLVTDIDMATPTRTALPDAKPAPEAKVPAQLLPQLPKKFAVVEPTKPEDSVAEVKEKEKEPPARALPAAEPTKAPEVVIKTDTKDDNKMDQADILKRAALERLRLEEKKAATAEAPEKDPMARLAEAYEKNKKTNLAFGSAAGKGRIKAYGALLKQAVHQNYSLPEAYNLKGASLKVAIAITVGERGDLMDLQVKQPSSDPAFDELTVQAVKASAPLPKPPAELVGVQVVLTFTP